MPRNKGWFRLYSRMIDSPQVLELSDREFRGIVSIWCIVSEHDKDGELQLTNNGLRRRIWPDASPDEIEEMILKYKSLDLLTGTEGKYKVPRWEIHQYEYESRIPRNRKDLQKVTNGKKTENERKVNGKVDPDKDPDTDTENPPIIPHGDENKPRPPFKNQTQEQFFNQFWNVYPKKIAKGAAEKAWNKIKQIPDDEFLEKVINALTKAKASPGWTKDGGEYIPNPATWINQKRWLDEIKEEVIQPGRNSKNSGESTAKKYPTARIE